MLRQPLPLIAAVLAAALLSVPSPTRAQFVLEAPSGEEIVYDSARVRDMLERSRRLRQILEQDPDVIYYIGSGPAATRDSPSSGYPWNAVRPRADSAARVAFPTNLREASRAYYNYAVKKMETIRGSPPTSDCTVAVEREVTAMNAWVDGWVVARTLYGGPPFGPLDAFAFAREAGHLPAMLVALGNSEVGGCLDRWRREHPDAMEAYRQWRSEVYEDEDEGG